MAREMGQLYVGIDCSNCGVHGEGTPAESGGTRCAKCGRFGSEAQQYCASHDVNYAALNGYDHCPMCREEQRVEQMAQEMHERRADPRMHNSVDARRF